MGSALFVLLMKKSRRGDTLLFTVMTKKVTGLYALFAVLVGVKPGEYRHQMQKCIYFLPLTRKMSSYLQKCIYFCSSSPFQPILPEITALLQDSLTYGQLSRN
jgi:hypothetical protein